MGSVVNWQNEDSGVAELELQQLKYDWLQCYTLVLPTLPLGYSSKPAHSNM